MKLKSPKDKGSRHEREVAEILRHYGFDAQRTPLSGAIENWKGDITTTAPLFIECKNTEKTKFLEWYKKADGESKNLPAVIVWTCNRNDIFCFLRFVDLMEIATNGLTPKNKKFQKKKDRKQQPDATDGLAFSKSHQARKPNNKLPIDNQ